MRILEIMLAVAMMGTLLTGCGNGALSGIACSPASKLCREKVSYFIHVDKSQQIK